MSIKIPLSQTKHSMVNRHCDLSVDFFTQLAVSNPAEENPKGILLASSKLAHILDSVAKSNDAFLDRLLNSPSDVLRCPKAAESVILSLLKAIGKYRKKQIYYLYVQYNLHILFLAMCPTHSGHFLSGFHSLAPTNCPSEKGRGDLAYIAVNLTLRYLVAKCANFHVCQTIGDKLAPLQLGFGTPLACEAAVHAERA